VVLATRECQLSVAVDQAPTKAAHSDLETSQWEDHLDSHLMEEARATNMVAVWVEASEEWAESARAASALAVLKVLA